jgi:protocatechuate 4,5-dioxygenase beta chain
MAHIIGSVCSTHVPSIGGAIARGAQNDPYWKPFFDGFPPVREWLAKVRPDVVVVFYNDHGLNFFLNNMPTFAVGAAPEYRNEDEGWGIPSLGSYKGQQKLSWHIIETLVQSDFDPATCQEMLVDHAFTLPLKLLWPDGDFPLPVVPIALNTVQHPAPSAKRCLALGRAVGKALQSWPGDQRVLVVGTGGLSHQLDGTRAGFINMEYDELCLNKLVNEPEALTGHSNREIIELAGSQGLEIINWLAARGGLPGTVREVRRNYHVPISNTASALQVLECAWRRAG